MSDWQIRFAAWQAFAAKVESHAKAIDEMRMARVWKLAESVGIGRDMCCLHNASIDNEMTGWCKGNPHRLKVAKRARHIADDWTASRLASRIVSRAYDRMLRD